MYGVTKTGFSLKAFSNIMNDIQERYRARLQDNQYILDFNTPEGIHSEAIGYELKEIWESMLELNNQMNLNTATGVYLDYFGTLLRTPRMSGSFARGQVKITGNQNLVIPFNTVIRYGEIRYFTLNTVTLDEQEGSKYKKIVFIQALEEGISGNITEDVEFESDYRGIEKITNDTNIEGGSDSETDELYRARLKKQNTLEKTAIHKAIYDAVMSLENVKDCFILDPETVPVTEPGTMKIYIDGSPSDNIFDKILETKADGILTLPDSNAQPNEKILRIGDRLERKITYNLIKYATLKIRVEVNEVKNSEEKDSRWTPVIKKEILNYINNLKSGEDISYVKVYSEILGIDDIRKIVLKMGLTSSEVQEHPFDKVFDVPIGQKFHINEENIEVVYV